MNYNHLDVVSLAKAYRGNTVIENLNFSVTEGELVSLLGPSGCGKTTLLRSIAGLTRVDEGDIVLSGNVITRQPAHKRNISVVFQNYALFPHLSVSENVAFGLRARAHTESGISRKVSDALSLVRMSEFADRSIAALSGGQQQRVAVARALVVEPELLLLDEPFSALDRKLRETMQVELKTLLRQNGITAVFVTHDQDEALAVSDRIAVMNEGRIEQFDKPGKLYTKPATAFVLGFVGLSTQLQGKVVEQAGSTAIINTSHGRIAVNEHFSLDDKVTIAVRPELMTIGQPPGEHTHNCIQVVVQDVMCLGSKTLIHGETTADNSILCEVSGIDQHHSVGKKIMLNWAINDTLAYGKN